MNISFSENESSDESEDQKENSSELSTPNSADKGVIYLETPLVDQSDEKSSVDESDTSDKKSNRLSDEFFSADDDDICISENESKNTSQSEKNVSDTINYDIAFSKSKSPDTNKPSEISQLVDFQEENSTDDNVIARSTASVFMEDEMSSCSNLIGLSNEQDESSPHSSGSNANIHLNENCDEANHGDEHNTVDRAYYSDQVQLIDAIERSDFEEEQKLIGTNLIKETALVSDENRLNIGMLKTFSQFDTNETGNNICNSNLNENDKTLNDDNSQESLSIALNSESKTLATTPTSSRKKIDRTIVKSISKINFADNLEEYRVDNKLYNDTVVSLNKPSSTGSNLLSKPSDASADASTYTNNSSESLLSDKSCQTPSFLQIATVTAAEECPKIKFGKYNECHDIASTSKSFSNENCQYSSVSSNSTKITSTITQPEQNDHITVQEEDSGISEEISKSKKSNPPISSIDSNSERMSSSTNNTDRSNNLSEGNNFNPQTSHALDGVEPHQDYDEDTWADCEDVYDMEEICTCQDYSDEDAHASSEDELPSRDVDLSCYTHLDSISEDILHEGSSETPRNYRKRKITETVTSFSEGACGDVTPANRKRLALDNVSVTKLPCTPTTPITLTSPSPLNSLVLSEKRTPRSIIPTRDNPPPELSDWLLQFQRWSHVERLVAVDRLIEHCEPTQVRHMMKVIEPQFQRDFISLLPKELALQVLSYLEPRDLLRAAQTCRSWRYCVLTVINAGVYDLFMFFFTDFYVTIIFCGKRNAKRLPLSLSQALTDRNEDEPVTCHRSLRPGR